MIRLFVMAFCGQPAAVRERKFSIELLGEALKSNSARKQEGTLKQKATQHGRQTAGGESAGTSPWSTRTSRSTPGPRLKPGRQFCKFLAGSFSAVSKRNFARKYAFDSIFQALQDVHTFAPLQTQHVTWIFSKNRFKTTASIVKLQQQFR